MYEEKERPLVSVGLMTYNHEKYIAKCIESVLMQEVNFTYEIVIADDFSTDGTRQILEEFQKRYPFLIRLILNEENLGIKENSNRLRRSCRGYFRANLEGDDYWIDPNKLQKQVDFLQRNPDYVAIGGNFLCVDDEGRPTTFPWGDIRYTYCFNNEYTIEDFKKWLLFGHTSTMMFRNFFYDCGEEINRRFDEVNMLGDRRICLFLVLKGRIRHVNEIWMVRRVLKKSKTSMTNAVRNSNYLWVNYEWMLEAERYSREQFGYPLDLSEKKLQRWLGSLKVFVKSPNQENWSVVKEIFRHSRKKTRYLFKAFTKGIKKGMNSIRKRGIVGTISWANQLSKRCMKEIKGVSSKPPENDHTTQSILRSFSK